eukprot:scpid70920/ scgid3211/ Serine/threonine-protein kinase STE20
MENFDLPHEIFGPKTYPGEDSIADVIFVPTDEEISSGHRCKVFPAYIPGEMTEGSSVVKCRMFNASRKLIDSVVSEVLSLKKCYNPHIVMFYGAMQYPGGVAMFMESLDGWTLREIQDDSAYTRVPEYVMRPITHQILKGLKFLNEADILHNNICRDNIMVTESGVVKILGFSSCQQLPLDTDTDGNVEVKAAIEYPCRYYPPERQPQVSQLPITTAIDIWGLGVTIFQMVTARSPNVYPVCFPRGKYFGTHQRVVMNFSALLWDEAYESLSDDLKRLICHCLIYNPERRPAAMDLLHDFWFTDTPGYKPGYNTEYMERSTVLSPAALQRTGDMLKIPPSMVRDIVMQEPGSLVDLLYNVQERGEWLQVFDEKRKRDKLLLQGVSQVLGSGPKPVLPPGQAQPVEDWNNLIVAYCAGIFACIEGAEGAFGQAQAAAAAAGVSVGGGQNMVVGKTEFWRPTSATTPNEEEILEMEREAAEALRAEEALREEPEEDYSKRRASRKRSLFRRGMSFSGLGSRSMSLRSRKVAYESLDESPECIEMKALDSQGKGACAEPLDELPECIEMKELDSHCQGACADPLKEVLECIE